MSSLPPNPVETNRLKQTATCASVVLSVSLMLLKLFASLYTGSLAVLSSLVDSVSDIFASVITFVAVRFASQPASREHRYGYGKAEALSALVQSAFVAGSGVFVIYEGIYRVFHPHPLADAGLGITVMVISLLATLALIAFQRYVVKKTRSLAVSADSVHYTVDVATNGSIIASLIVVKFFGIDWFDTAAAVFISFYLLLNAYKIAKDAVSLLLDRELPPEIRETVVKIVANSSFCRGLHDLRSRDLGGVYLFEFHLELDGNLSLYEAHKLGDIIEFEIKRLYPGAQVIIHQDPAGLEEERLDNRLVK